MNCHYKIESQNLWTNALLSGRNTYRRLQEIGDQMDQALANGATADEAEAMAIEQIQKLGGEMLQDWAQARQRQALWQARTDHPQSIKHLKKKQRGSRPLGR